MVSRRKAPLNQAPAEGSPRYQIGWNGARSTLAIGMSVRCSTEPDCGRVANYTKTLYQSWGSDKHHFQNLLNRVNNNFLLECVGGDN
jgi:hypothetical protein